MYEFFLKRVIDFTIALVGLFLLSPVFIIVLFLLLIYNNGKPFFFQERPGKNEKIFKVIKFKTMNDKKDQKGNLLPDAERLTSIGNFVRKTSLDEVPQLLNVLKGDMSLIGPRPLLVEYLPRYNEEQKRRHDVRPGITGLAQVNGRNAISWKRKFEYDVEYVDKINLILDINIFIKTFLKVFISEGINKEGEVTTTKFTGNENE